jgi:hypothetical protein
MMELTDDVNSDNIYPVTDWRQKEYRWSREVVLLHVVRGEKTNKGNERGASSQWPDG